MTIRQQTTGFALAAILGLAAAPGTAQPEARQSHSAIGLERYGRPHREQP